MLLKLRQKYRLTLTIIFIVAIGFGILYFLQKNTTTVNSPKAPKYEESIYNAVVWLRHSRDQIHPFQWLALNYLERKYVLSEEFEAKNIELKPVDGQFGLELQTYTRIIKPDQLVNSLPLANATPMSQMMMMAANCDHIPLPANFLELLQENIDLGGYNLTHVSFSLERMRENGCTINPQKEQPMRQNVAVGMTKLVTEPGAPADLRYEAIAFLQAMGRRDLIQPVWMEQIASEQKPDGRWGDTENVNDHPTVLALWALLEYTRPNAPPIPMISRP